MDRDKLLDQLQEIQDKNNETFAGFNEAELHTREDIADLIQKILDENKFVTLPELSQTQYVGEIKRLMRNFIDLFSDLDSDTKYKLFEKLGSNWYDDRFSVREMLLIEVQSLTVSLTKL